jgi:small-conductance mechanosensitive channel/CRP-like cAMP-binding protein
MTPSQLDATLMWVVVFTVVTPLVVIGSGELEGRLRYRDSRFVPVVSTLRLWVLPLTATWLVTGAILGFESLLARLVASAALVAVAADIIAVVRVLIDSVRAHSASGARRQVPGLLLAVPRLLVIIVAAWLLVVLVWDFDLSSLFAALGVTSLIISVALQDTLSSIASGFTLMLDRPFQPGDWIDAEGIEGRVVDVNWRSTRIETRNLDIVVVPNGTLASAIITNYDEPAKLHRIKVELQVAFANPPTLAKDMILDAARSVPGVLADPTPTVYVTQVDDPLMGYEVRMWVDDFSIAPRVRSDFRSLVWYMSHRHDVPLPSPAYDLYNYDGLEVSASAIPDRAEIRRRLQVSDLFDTLDDDELDRLSAMSKPDRFEVDESVAGIDLGDRVLYTLWTGRAHLEVVRSDGSVHTIAALAAGDVFGLVQPAEDGTFVPRVVADTDCEVISTDLSVAGPLIARNPGLVEALNQITTTRTRRIDRLASDSYRAAAIDTGHATSNDSGEEVDAS